MPSVGGKWINYYYSTITWMAIMHHLKWVILCTIFICGYVVLGCYHAYLEIIMFGFPATSVHKAVSS